MLAGERPEDELRHRHIGGGVDPLAGHVADHDGEAAVGEHGVVEDVAADVQAGRGLVDAADLDAGDVGRRRRQSERCIASAKWTCCS